MSSPTTTPPDTATRILDSAERLVQTYGFNGFSYADVAAEVGVTKASLHYHFSGKAELGQALIERYTAQVDAALAQIDEAGLDAPARLRAYARIYAEVLRRERLCLCGMLASEYETLSDRMRRAVARFFEHNEGWLAAVLLEGRTDRTLHFEGSPQDAARALLGALEGAMLLARPYGGLSGFEADAERLLASIAGVA